MVATIFGSVNAQKYSLDLDFPLEIQVCQTNRHQLLTSLKSSREERTPIRYDEVPNQEQDALVRVLRKNRSHFCMGGISNVALTLKLYTISSMLTHNSSRFARDEER